MDPIRWIWQAPSWPRLTFDAARLARPLALARQESGALFGKAAVIGLEEQAGLEHEVWSHEAVATAAIEGEVIDLAAVRSSVARRLGLARQGPAVPRNVEGLLDVMENAADDWEQPLTRERLCAWQAALFPGGSSLRNLVIGEYRSSDDPMQIVSGPHGREIVHYQAVASAAVRAEMHAFLEWFNRTVDLDGLLRAGVAHVWFESIHPFDDGNGRIGRAVVDIALAQDARRSSRLLGISSAMRQRQAAYYDALNVAQRGDGEVTPWLEWFLDTYTEACRTSAKLIDEALARARFWTDHRAVPLNEMQRRVLCRMLDAGPGRFDGGLTARKYTVITGTTRVTASRHIADLLEKGLIVRAAGPSGRSTRYDLALPGWEWRPPMKRRAAAE
ncbi:MAG: Fic family protein [Steroidobacteraceae bacterium]|nr:Fic family protein [Steroidobacteraceae bacterium]MBP9129016.1 Fic family protein [Steroidobacteraceae bacterium]